MIRAIGIKFRPAGKIYFFKPFENESLEIGDKVIVETSKGVELGEVSNFVEDVPSAELEESMKDIIRKATAEDIKQVKSNQILAKEAYQLCRLKIREHGLDMKLSTCEYTFDRNKLLFYFTADDRIDFRELVKDLASAFKTRIELRQIGVRDETKLMGGLGMCGRELCCASYMREFSPVSIKMAKDQNLSLNPTKISGMCGRLMCCLNNEEETYRHLTANLPSVGKPIKTKSGVEGIVKSVDILRQRVHIVVEVDDEKTIEEYPVEELEVTKVKGGCCRSGGHGECNCPNKSQKQKKNKCSHEEK